ncbi:MAG: ThiF family adenylyltransferase [Bacteroidales bacterium]|jgi:molybdopterin/thiamine biosynthesis adenylyltransferase|nr:ThiF family adenylyltransferase [Bacteroidales bacterium]
MYKRNRLYIGEAEQEQIRRTKIVFGGLGIGSVIAECALRMGFETLHLIDGDTVELSNLNRQNYRLNDVGKPKCVALFEHLKHINPNANITYSNVFLTADNMAEHLAGADIAVNAIDFTSDAPLIFDEVCVKKGIPVVHPYNFGYGGLVLVLTKESPNLRLLSNEYRGMEITVANYVLDVLAQKGIYIDRFRNMLTEYTAQCRGVLHTPLLSQSPPSPPQLSIASWLLGGMCTDIFLKLVRNESVSVFPKFYYLDNNQNQF